LDSFYNAAFAHRFNETGANERAVSEATNFRDCTIISKEHNQEVSMKRIGLVAMFVALSVGALWANGNAEKLSTVEGLVVQVTPLEANAQVALQLANGETVEVLLPVEELARLQIQERVQIRFQGVLVKGDENAQIQTRLYARTCEINGKQEQVKNAVKLSTQDQERLRLQLKDGSGDQIQTQTQTQTQTRTQTNTGTSTASQNQSSKGKK